MRSSLFAWSHFRTEQRFPPGSSRASLFPKMLLGRDLIGFRVNPGLERAHAAARHRNRIAILRGELDQAAVSGPLQADHAVEVDDVAAVHADEAGGVEPRFDVADRQRTEQLRRSGENV